MSCHISPIDNEIAKFVPHNVVQKIPDEVLWSLLSLRALCLSIYDLKNLGHCTDIDISECGNY
jgi:hypothetical protein